MKNMLKKLFPKLSRDKGAESERAVNEKYTEMFERVAERYKDTFINLELYDNGKKELSPTDILSGQSSVQNS